MRDQRIRIAKSQADALELNHRATAGELLDAGEVEREWSDMLRKVRAGMLAVPSRCGSRLAHLTTHDLAEIDAEVRAALTEVANNRTSG
jgi:phage terminase Nu1 subunit (DNA packaging protein)